MNQLSFCFKDDRPQKPWFPCIVWEEWYQMLGFGYSVNELKKRIQFEYDTYARWHREVNEFRKQQGWEPLPPRIITEKI